MIIILTDNQLLFFIDKLYNSTIISVRNHGRFDEPNGEVTEIRGMAIATSAPGKFRLRLGNLPFEGSCTYIDLLAFKNLALS